MESILRGLAIYFFLLLIFRLSGKRTLSTTTSFDLVLVLIVSETTQQALAGSDHSFTAAAILIVTLVGTDIVLSVLKQRFPAVDRVLDGEPIIIVRNGKALKDRMDSERVDEYEVLEAAREQHGLERIDQVRYAVLERSGHITVVPEPAGEA
jgi:uncharacterized membrane protein YcaP (DUF421 family)